MANAFSPNGQLITHVRALDTDAKRTATLMDAGQEADAPRAETTTTTIRIMAHFCARNAAGAPKALECLCMVAMSGVRDVASKLRAQIRRSSGRNHSDGQLDGLKLYPAQRLNNFSPFAIRSFVG